MYFSYFLLATNQAQRHKGQCLLSLMVCLIRFWKLGCYSPSWGGYLWIVKFLELLTVHYKRKGV